MENIKLDCDFRQQLFSTFYTLASMFKKYVKYPIEEANSITREYLLIGKYRVINIQYTFTNNRKRKLRHI